MFEYEIKKDGAWYLAVCKQSGQTHFRSLKRGNVKDWIAANTASLQTEEEEPAEA